MGNVWALIEFQHPHLNYAVWPERIYIDISETSDKAATVVNEQIFIFKGIGWYG